MQKREQEERKKDYDNDSDDDEFWKDANKETSDEFPDFPDFDAKLRESLSNLNGRAFVKLNWSSPRDAFWSLNKSYCESLSDIYILLRSSDFVSHDLNYPFDGCDDAVTAKNELKYFLIMRRWLDLNPMMEFRCFVRENTLVGSFLMEKRVEF